MCTRPPRTPGRTTRQLHRDDLCPPHLPRIGRRLCIALFLAPYVLAGCAGVAARGMSEPVPYADAPLLADEIRRSGAQERGSQTAYDAVRLLRFSFLSTGGQGARGQVELSERAVYVGGTRVGGLEALRSIPLRNVAAIRLVKPLDAATAFGPGHSAGALIVDLVR